MNRRKLPVLACAVLLGLSSNISLARNGIISTGSVEEVYGPWLYHTDTYNNFYTKTCHYQRKIQMVNKWGSGAIIGERTEYRSITVSAAFRCSKTIP